MAKVVVVTSGKGGVGKTTSTAALGAALAQMGESVVIVDFDVGLRNLDLILGAERRVVFDLINVVQGIAKLSQALIRDKRLENLWLLPASQTRDKDALTDDGVRGVIAELRTKFDWILCDARHALRRRGRHRHQPRSFVRARLGPHHWNAGFEDREGGARRARREACTDYTI
jgi:septum site-determining protein MinD